MGNITTTITITQRDLAVRRELVLKGWERWEPGKPLLINRIQWDSAELMNITDVFSRDWFASGHYVDAFQKALAEFTGNGQRFFLTNSGSTALETAVMTLMKLGELKPGDYVLHPALTFNTSASCFAKFGMVPVFVDSIPGTYNIDAEMALQALNSHDIKAIVLPHILGNTTDIDAITEEADFQHIPIIGDSCDTLGTRWKGKEVSAYSDFTAYSFYGSHHITTAGVGGALSVREPASEAIVKSLIHWGRDWEAEQTFGNRYAYSTLGSDYQMTEIQAAFGLAQLERVPGLNRRRAQVFALIRDTLKSAGMEQYFIFPIEHKHATPSWFGFPLTVKSLQKFTREQFIEKLLARKIECRPMFSGNTLKHTAWQGVERVVVGDLHFADFAYSHSFFLPAWAMPDEAVEHLTKSVIESVKELVV